MSIATAPPRLEISAEEGELRVQLAAAYRIFAMLGWTELIYNHITLRVPGPERHFLINPFGLHYSEVTASNLVKIDLDGRPVSPTRWPVNPAGFKIHAAIHSGIEGAHCVMHTHTTAGMAVACGRACEIQLASAAMGPVIEISEDIQMKCTADSLQFDPRFGAGRDVFDALTRMIDKADPSYRE